MSLPSRPALILLAALLGAASGPALAEAAGSGITQIYLQRDADGRSVLTDRPSATSITERTWQMEREDPAAARQRALEMQREAAAVSLRVQRSIDAQTRQAGEENMQRRQLALADRQSEIASAQSEAAPLLYGPLAYGPLGFRPRSHHARDHRPHPGPRSPLHPAPMRGAAPLQRF